MAPAGRKRQQNSSGRRGRSNTNKSKIPKVVASAPTLPEEPAAPVLASVEEINNVVVPVRESFVDPEVMALAFTLPQNQFGSGGGGDDDGGERITPEPVDLSITLESVGGLKEHVDFIRSNVLYSLQHIDDLAEWGMEPSKGVIFHGPPGTGKTLLAKALASELSRTSVNGKKISFFMRKGSDCYSKWIGDSEKTIRKLFRTAIAMKPSVIFFDELDGLCPARGGSNNHHFYTSVVTCMLGQMDAVKRGEVFFIGATNRLDSIDAALKRPGRFDKHLAFAPPNTAGRNRILDIHLTKWKSHKPNAELISSLAERTVGFTGADLEQFCREAFNCALSRQMPDIGQPGTNHNLRNLRVIDQDWEAALSKMGRSNSNVFGNSIFTVDAVHPTIGLLVSGIVGEISCHIQNYIPGDDEGNSKKDLTMQTLLISSGGNCSTLDMVNTFMIPSFMVGLDVEKTPAFILQDPRQFYNVFTQLFGSRKACSILFIPHLEPLWDNLMRMGLHNAFRENLEKTRGTGMIVVATSMTPLQDLPDELQSLFSGNNKYYEVRGPSTEERGTFFAAILNPDTIEDFLGVELSKDGQKKLACEVEELKREAVRVSNDLDIRETLDLHGEIAHACRNFPDDQRRGKNGGWGNLYKILREVIDNFGKSS